MLEKRHSPSPEATEALGRELGPRLQGGDLIVLHGELAAGKTTFVRGLAEGLGADPDEVSSPSYVLIQEYPCSSGVVSVLYHVDLYRLEDDPSALRTIGLEELLSEPNAVVAIEWPLATVLGWQPRQARLWTLRFAIGEYSEREILIDAPETA